MMLSLRLQLIFKRSWFSSLPTLKWRWIERTMRFMLEKKSLSITKWKLWRLLFVLPRIDMNWRKTSPGPYFTQCLIFKISINSTSATKILAINDQLYAAYIFHVNLRGLVPYVEYYNREKLGPWVWKFNFFRHVKMCMDFTLIVLKWSKSWANNFAIWRWS